MVREKVAYRRSRKPTGPVRFNNASSCASRSGPGWSSSNANQEPPPWRIDLCRTATTCANSRGVSGTDCWALLIPRTVSLGLTIPCSAAAPPSLKAATTTLPVLQVVSHLWRAQHIQCGAVRRPGGACGVLEANPEVGTGAFVLAEVGFQQVRVFDVAPFLLPQLGQDQPRSHVHVVPVEIKRQKSSQTCPMRLSATSGATARKWLSTYYRRLHR